MYIVRFKDIIKSDDVVYLIEGVINHYGYTIKSAPNPLFRYAFKSVSNFAERKGNEWQIPTNCLASQSNMKKANII